MSQRYDSLVFDTAPTLARLLQGCDKVMNSGKLNLHGIVEIWWVVTLGVQHNMHPFTMYSTCIASCHCIVDFHLTYK